MLKKPILGVTLVLALLCFSTFAYWSTSQGALTYYSIQGEVDANSQVTLTLFNPSTSTTTSYQLYLQGGTETGQLAPLASITYSAPDTGQIRLEADAELIAWNQVRSVADNLEYGRDTQPFITHDGFAYDLVFPWFEAREDGETGFLNIFNTGSFTTDLVLTTFDAATGTATAGETYQIPPFQYLQVPAMTNHVGPTQFKYCVVNGIPNAPLIGQYIGPAGSNYRYWAEQTYAFTSLSALRDVPQAPAVARTRKLAASRSTLPFSSDHLLFQGNGIDSWYSFVDRYRDHQAASGTLYGELVQASPFTHTLAPIATNAPTTFDAFTFFPNPNYRSGTLAAEIKTPTPTGLAVYRSAGDLATASPAPPMTHRAVFPVDGREPWQDQLADSVFVFNNRQNTDLPIAVGLLDQQGNLLDVHYPVLAPGASEIPVAQLVNGQADTRILLFESGRIGDLLSLHLMVTGSGSNFSAPIVDYIAPSLAPGCSTVGLGPEHYYNWGRAYTVSCEDRPASVLGLVQQVNQGHPPPYAD